MKLLVISFLVCLYQVNLIHTACPDRGTGSGSGNPGTLPKSCKEIKENDPSAKSGVYLIVSGLEVYCEMVIDDGGYTFLPWSTLQKDANIIDKIYTDTSKVLFRIISKDDKTNQLYIITKQLDMYSNLPISIQMNSCKGYQCPVNSYINFGPFIYFGFLPANFANKAGMIQGMSANGHQLTFTNCDYNPNSYISLFQPINTPSLYDAGYYNFHQDWLGAAHNHPLNTYLPSKYFSFVEIHQGGCGEYTQSNRWLNFDGAAFGIK
jgi:hypothetical protein